MERKVLRKFCVHFGIFNHFVIWLWARFCTTKIVTQSFVSDDRRSSYSETARPRLDKKDGCEILSNHRNSLHLVPAYGIPSAPTFLPVALSVSDTNSRKTEIYIASISIDTSRLYLPISMHP